jgi:regulator of RNase E activity RraA
MNSRESATAASAGDILMTRLMVRGGAGVVTHGGFRDAATIGALDIPAYRTWPSSPTNRTTDEAIEINGPIGCGDAPVFPGNPIVGDEDGVIVIPAGIADEVAAEAVAMTACEDFAVERVRDGESVTRLYPRTKPEHGEVFARWREANGR